MILDVGLRLKGCVARKDFKILLPERSIEKSIMLGSRVIKVWISCQYLHFTSIEDIYLKSSIPGQSSILRVTERSPQVKSLRSLPTTTQEMHASAIEDFG
jgi:hypothetical protein